MGSAECGMAIRQRAERMEQGEEEKHAMPYALRDPQLRSCRTGGLYARPGGDKPRPYIAPQCHFDRREKS